LTGFFILTLGYSTVLKAFAKYQTNYDIGFKEYTGSIDLNSLILPLVFYLCFLVGAVLGSVSVSPYRFETLSLERLRYYRPLSALLAVFAIFSVLFLLEGSTWLAINREVAASVNSSLFRYLYPFILCFTILYLVAASNSQTPLTKIKIIVLTLFSFLTFSLISLRGWFIVSTLIILHIYVIRNRVKFIAVLVAILALILLGVFLKDVAQYVLSDEYYFSTDVLARIAQKAQGDYIDIFYVIEQYVAIYGHEYGTSFLGYFLHFLPVDLRVEYLPSSTDKINMFLDENTYLNRRFGYNVSSLQDAYINFGYLSFPVALLIGYIMLKIEVRLWTVFYRTGFFSLSLFFSVFFFQNYGSLKWVFLGVALDVSRLVIQNLLVKKTLNKHRSVTNERSC